MKNGTTAFYKTTTDDSKKKAGQQCAQAFIAAFQNAVRAH
jgi:hypothetical protein